MAAIVFIRHRIAFRQISIKDESASFEAVNLIGTSESEQRSDGCLAYTLVAYSSAVVCTADGD